MSTILFFLLLCLSQHVPAEHQPDIDCLIIHLEYISCFWANQRPPSVNYTFSSSLSSEAFRECATYVLENGTTTGCNQPYDNLKYRRFNRFEARLTHGNQTLKDFKDLKDKVLLNPPTNLSVHNGSDFNLYIYWNQTFDNCVESEVRFRTNNNKWETAAITCGKRNHIINLPSSKSRYEVKVRSRVCATCGESLYWSEWSRPAVWGSNNSTDPKPEDASSVLTTLLYSLGAFVFVLLLAMLLYHERVRIIPISVVPKPSLGLYDIEDWLQFSKSLKGNFKPNYTERTCTVSEYYQLSQSQDDVSMSSSVSTDQTDCSASVPVEGCEDLSVSGLSSASTFVFQSEEKDQHLD